MLGMHLCGDDQECGVDWPDTVSLTGNLYGEGSADLDSIVGQEVFGGSLTVVLDPSRTLTDSGTYVAVNKLP